MSRRWVTVLLAVTMAAGFSAYRPPPVNAPFDYQLGGAYRPPAGVRVVTRDRTARPAPGRYGICYVNAFQTQPEQRHWWEHRHPRLLLRHHGALVHDPGWPGEILLDTATASRRHGIARILGRWMRGCARKGFDAVEPDNLDSFTRSHHELTRRDNLTLARRLVVLAHRDDLAIAQKNLAELGRAAAHRVGFDFAVAEDCQVYRECSRYRHVYGRHVIEIEYADDGRANFERACALRGSVWSIVYRDRDLVGPRHASYRYDAC